jgi:hypothetical protein
MGARAGVGRGWEIIPFQSVDVTAYEILAPLGTGRQGPLRLAEPFQSSRKAAAGDEWEIKSCGSRYVRDT